MAIAILLVVPAFAQGQESDAGTKKKEEMTDTAKPPAAKSNEAANRVAPPSRNWTSQLFKDFAGDQKELWTSPKDLRFSDSAWLVPLSGVTAGLFVTDADFSRHEVSGNLKTQSRYTSISNYAAFGMAGGAGAMWLLSYANHNSQWRETGFLAGEAAINSLVMTETFKYSLGRERPFQGDGSGNFFQRGTSFPSEHSAAVWSIASVIAHEYPGPLTKILAYGAAGLVSYSRVKGHQHFLSDAMVGALIGEFTAYKVYSRHHDPELGGATWQSLSEQVREMAEHPNAASLGSPYVPLDSWIYSAFDRLAGMGYLSTGIVGMRPWTRLECKRLLNEAEDLIGSDDRPAPGSQELVDALEKEFRFESESLEKGSNRSLHLESVYTRTTGIAGSPLTNGFFFGQTLLNDFGRPFSEGFNQVIGSSAWASEGPLAVYVRGEYQYAPSIPALPLGARQFIASPSVNGFPLPPDISTESVSQFQLLDAYVSLTLKNWQLSFGKQSLSWGPSVGGAMMFSNNASPLTMFRVNRVSPFEIPLVSSLLGPMRTEFFVGRLTGHQFIFGQNTGFVGQWGTDLNDQPFIVGEKLNFKPTRNFEFGVSFTQITGGTGQPFTFHQFLLSTFFGPLTGTTHGLPGTSTDAGDARSGVDFTYKVPGLRNWLTFYGEAFTEDEYSPLGYPRKSAYQGGIYLPRIPGVPKLDLRVEGGSTEPADFGTCVGCFYFNGRFRNAYTNDGNLMGSWLGRAGQGEQVWSTYWLSSRNTIQFHARHQKAVANFVPDGGTVNDVGISANIWLTPNVRVSGLVQYEKWNYPILAAEPQTNVTSSFGITFTPGGRHYEPWEPRNEVYIKWSRSRRERSDPDRNQTGTQSSRTTRKKRGVLPAGFRRCASSGYLPESFLFLEAEDFSLAGSRCGFAGWDLSGLSHTQAL